jgi:hypothetical protein
VERGLKYIVCSKDVSIKQLTIDCPGFIKLMFILYGKPEHVVGAV